MMNEEKYVDAYLSSPEKYTVYTMHISLLGINCHEHSLKVFQIHIPHFSLA